MRKIFYFTLINFLLCTVAYSQGYKINVHLESAAGKQIQLAHHYLGSIYVDDTLTLDASGSGVFEGDTLLHEGLYKIYLDKDNHFDFLLGADQQFTLTNKTFDPARVEVSGSTDTGEFVKYLRFLNDLRQQNANLKKQLNEASPDERQAITDEMKKLNESMEQYWFDLNQKYPGHMVSKFVIANYVPALDVSTLPEKIQKNDSLLLMARFNYQHQHFWDYFDYTDPRMMYTPFYKPKLETWFNKVLYPDYDSVKPYVYAFLEEVRPQKRIFQYATSFFLNSSINSKVLGMDALFIDIARDFYLSGEAFWASEESMEKIRENVLFMENGLIGKTAPDLTLESFDGEFYNLHQIDAKITIVLIYEPNCSHCRVFVPELYKEVYLPFRDKGLEVFAIYSMDDREEWSGFLTKHNLFDWINVWDEHHTSRFKILYDGRQTPGVFVLDENKTIVSKKLTIEQLKNFLQKELD